MLTKSNRRELEKLFDAATPAERMSIDELEGFLYAVAITPDIIPPSQWLPEIFDGEMPELANLEQANTLMGALMNAYNHYNTLRLQKKLHYPYDMNRLSEADLEPLMEWCYGFLQGLRLRIDIWTSGIVAEDMNAESDPVVNSVGIIQALVEEDFDAIDNFDRIKADFPEDMSDEEFKLGMLARLITLVPLAVENIQTFGDTLDEYRQKMGPPPSPMRTEKAGRNDPCPCGSGKKYKKCCGAGGKEATLH